MIRICHYGDSQGVVRADLAVEDLPAFLEHPQGILWLDLVETPAEEARPLLEGIFGFHPLAVDDALVETHLPKVDDWQDYLYLVFYVIRPDFDREVEIELLELDCFLTAHCLVTYQAKASDVVNQLWRAVQVDPRFVSRGAPYLLYQLLDGLMVDYMKALEELDDRVEMTEDSIFAAPSRASLGNVFAYKRALLQLRRSLAPQREVLNKLARGDFPIIAESEEVYFRDIYDHLVRLYDITDTMRDVVNGTLDLYLSVVNNHMNDVMKTLTIITTLFMPLTFLAGFFGMNFFAPSAEMPVWSSPLALGLTLAAMTGLPLLMYGWMHRRGLV